MERFEIELAQGWSKGLKIVFEDIAGSRSIDLNSALHVHQVHGAQIHELSSSDLSKVAPLTQADGLMVQGDWAREIKKPLLIKTADCCPLVYVDRIQKSLAVVHAGWRGLQLGIHRKPFESGNFNPKDTWVWLGPCLNGESFEVGEDVWAKFGRRSRDEQIFCAHPDPQKKYFDVWRFLEVEFSELGVEVFYNTEIDTGKSTAFASWRRMNRALRAQGLDPSIHVDHPAVKNAKAVRNLTLVGFF